ncbi:hypothetical protein FRC12_023866 [Ceratobasidium sp. 428]|nr:hypothetical protein FRC12_023866 [Ceratobasidium sp. 428]
MPTTKAAPKKGLAVAKKGTKKASKPTKGVKHARENSEYEDSDASENEDQQNPASNDSSVHRIPLIFHV